MGDNAGMSKLVELIFGKKATIPEEKGVHSHVPSSLLTKDFSEILAEILFIRKMIVFHDLEQFIDKEIYVILSSHRNYLRRIMLVCMYQVEGNRNRFDNFISVIALVIKWNEEILKITGLNFSDLNPDIFVVFYRKLLKKSLHRHTDFYKLEEYIRCHKYLTWNWEDVLVDDSTGTVLNKSDDKIIEELHEHRIIIKELDDPKYSCIISLADEVFLTSSVALPTLPSKPDQILKLVAHRKKELAKKAKKQRSVDSALTIKALNGNSSLNSDAENHGIAKELEDIARHENIIQAVIMYNHSKKSDRENANNKLPEEVDGFLKHLKNSIESLTEVLDQCNKE